MPNPKRIVPITARGRDEALNVLKARKPIPPSDLWIKLQEAALELRKAATIPEGAFTREECQQKLDLTDAQVYRLLHTLRDGGKLKRVGRVAGKYYYVYME